MSNVTTELFDSGNTDLAGLGGTLAGVFIGLVVIFLVGHLFTRMSGSSSETSSKYNKNKSKNFNNNKYRTFVGVEIECMKTESNIKGSVLNKFNMYEGDDASIRGGDGSGVEYKSSPTQGDRLLKTIKDFSEELNKTKHKTNKSCGLHIHIETAPDLELMKKLYCFYSKYEGLFFAMLPESRQNNDYCKKFKRLDKFNYSDILKLKSIADFKTLYYEKESFYPEIHHGHKKRYCWVNFHSIFYRGTLEIRGHSGTISGEKINNWIMIHLMVRDYLEKNTIKNISKMDVSKKRFLGIFTKDLQDYIKERWKKFPETSEENFKEYK